MYLTYGIRAEVLPPRQGPCLHWYRYGETHYSAGCDEWGDPLPYRGRSVIQLHAFEVLRYTPKGVVLDDGSMNGRFICHNWTKQWAAPTPELARESFIARKKRQVGILSSRLRDAREAHLFVSSDRFDPLNEDEQTISLTHEDFLILRKEGLTNVA